MGLSPEERRKIYEEEKARIEAREMLEKERREAAGDVRVNLSPNITGVLCYLGIWVTGIIFFILEQKNKWIRFHAAQSIVVFGGLGIAMAILHWIPYVGWFFTVVIWIIGVVLWIVLMSKAYNGERYKLPIAGDIAEMMVGIPINIPDRSQPPPRASRKAPPARAGAIEGETAKTVDDFFKHSRERRITLSSLAIVGSIILLVVFNFLHQYIAYYTYHSVTKTWTWQSFFTSDINAWLPILNAALGVAILGNIVLIIINNPIIRETIHIIKGGLGLASVLTLLIVFPFDFSVIPNSDAAGWTTLGARIFLVIVAVCLGVSLVVRTIRLMVNSVKLAL